MAGMCLLMTACSSTTDGQPVSSSEIAGKPRSVPTVLILDASGSMTIDDAPGPRIDAAKNAAHGLLDAMPDDSTLGLETYGTSTGSDDSERTAGCRDVTTLLPLGALNRAATAAAIDAITPSGYTPISLALQTASDQLPADGTAQAIVLVSDGEDTCDTPPCDTAAALKRSHPGLAISTVGFKLDGPAADQLRCIADATGGLFVQATNANQLAARLLATQDLNQANKSLSATGIFGVSLGDTADTIRAKYSDFPAVETSGSVTVIWRDCDFGFVDNNLDSMRPHNGGRTIDGITAGSAVNDAVKLYGTALSTSPGAGGLTNVVFDADPGGDTAYRMEVDGFAQTGTNYSGTIKTITLCRCKPRANADPTRPADVTESTIRNMTFPVGACGRGSFGWPNTVPITLTDGKGEAKTASGEFGGASITDPKLVGWLDPDGNGTEDAVVSFTCFGSTFANCCAGRSSMMEFLGVFDFSDPRSPRPIGETIFPGSSPVRGETYGESRRIDQVRVDGSAIVTDEKLIYPDSTSAAEIGFSPYATIEVTHRFTNGQWTSTERVR